MHRSIVSRIKILADLDITELRLPQDGRFDFVLGSQKIAMRVSVMPVEYGLKLVLRLHGQVGGKPLLGLNDMLIAQPILQAYRQLIEVSWASSS